MNNNDDLFKNYIESQKRQRKIIEDSKKRRFENKNNAKQTKNLSINTKDQLNNDPDQAFLMTEIKTANLEMAEILYKKGNFKGAIPFFTKAIKIDPNIADYYVRRGLAKFNFIDQQETLDCLVNELVNTEYEYVPELPKSLKKDLNNYLGNFCDKNLNYQSAIDDFNKALEIDPNNNSYSFFLADAKRKIRKLEKNDE